MDEKTVLLASARARLAAALTEIDDILAGDGVVTDEVREIVAVSAFVSSSFRHRSMTDALTWCRRAKAGEQGWLVLWSLKGERRAEARFYRDMPASLRRHLEVDR